MFTRVLVLFPEAANSGGIVGAYHVRQQHLKRYLAEFDYLYNERIALGVDDMTRFNKSLPEIVGKRLTYRRIDA